jgi:hypothetical protein
MRWERGRAWRREKLIEEEGGSMKKTGRGLKT